MTLYIILAFFGGLGIGYLVFYFRYQHKDTINELRTNLKEASKEIRVAHSELEELSTQNIILKEKVSELLDKNEDLSHVTSELSKYYYHIKKASEKTKELTKFLQEPDNNIEDKIHQYTSFEYKNANSHITSEKKDFF